MGKLFSWSKSITPINQKENYKTYHVKPTIKQIKECLLLDQLFWIQSTKKPLSQAFEKIDKNWYSQVMKGAKYSRIGDSFIDPNQGIKCVKIERPDINKPLPIKPRVSVKRQTVKREVTKTHIKLESKPVICDSNQGSPSSSIDENSSSGSSGDKSLLSASEIVRQAQKFLPKLEISPTCCSNPITIYQTSSENIDVLNYDFSFTSPLIKS